MLTKYKKRSAGKADLVFIYYYLADVADSNALEAASAADSAALETPSFTVSAALEASFAADSTALEASFAAFYPHAVNASIATAAIENNFNFNICFSSLKSNITNITLCLLICNNFIPIYQKKSN